MSFVIFFVSTYCAPTMTVSYAEDISDGQGFMIFIKLLTRWVVSIGICACAPSFLCGGRVTCFSLQMERQSLQIGL